MILDASPQGADTPSKVDSETPGVPSPQKIDAFGSAADSTQDTPPAQTKKAIVIPQSSTERIPKIVQPSSLGCKHPVPPPTAKEPILHSTVKQSTQTTAKESSLHPTVDKFTPSSNVEFHQTNSQAKVGIALEDNNSNNSLSQEEILALKKANPSESLLRL